VEANDRAAIRAVAPYAIIGAIVLAFFWFSLRNPSSQVAEISGTIEAVTFRGDTDAPGIADRTAVIRLADGTMLQAHVAAPLSVHSGQQARIVVYERILSAERTYEVIDAHDAR
jgi:HAMP domain-containing protein